MAILRPPDSTEEGLSVTVTPAQVSTVRFSSVSSAGKTTGVALDNVWTTAVPFAYSLVNGLSYEVATSADVNGSATMCLAVPWAATAGAFANVRILHAENGAFVDRTILTGPDAPNAATKRVCAQAPSLDTFAVAMFDPNALDSIAPSLNVTLSPSVLSPPNNKLVTITASITTGDNADPAPAITLVSITIGGGDKGKKDDIQGAAIGTDDRSFQLRAEKGAKTGRIYTIVYRATDRSGNTTQVSRTVTVP